MPFEKDLHAPAAAPQGEQPLKIPTIAIYAALALVAVVVAYFVFLRKPQTEQT
jgi:flagellar basal body-associated protein FliL